MTPSRTRSTRRRFLAGSLLAGASPLLPLRIAGKEAAAPAGRSGPPRIAAIVTEYRPWSHADVICGRFIQGYSLDLTPHWPSVAIRSMYVDQFPETDLSRPLSKRYGFPLARSIREAILTPAGEVDVDGVLLIGEHGDYPRNERGQTLYPRRRFFEETAAALAEGRKVVPVFNDKHLAARWEDAKYMYEKARELGLPFMAGSSLPLAWRRPWLEIPLGTPIDEALAVGYGDVEAYGFHALETLQCMVERRRGGEAGVKAVQCLEGKAVWDAMREGRFSRELLLAALERHDPPIGEGFEARTARPVAFLIEYADGLRAACLILNDLASDFLFAARLTGSAAPAACQFWLQEPVFGHFSYLSNAIIRLFETGKPPYPVERTVLTTGILSAAMDSRFEGQRRIETPDLRIPYVPADHDLGAHRHPEAANTRHGGWIDLLGDARLGGWRLTRIAGEPSWRMAEGILTATGGHGHAATLEEFADFELFIEARFAGGPAREVPAGPGAGDVLFRVPPSFLSGDSRGEDPPGYALSCRAVSLGPGGLAAGPAPGAIVGLGEPAAAGRMPQEREGKEGRWLAVRLRAEGDRFRTWVGGEPAADCRDPGGRFRSGSILIRLPERGTVEVRELRVKRLG